MKPITLGCERGDQIQKYGSYDACMKEREKEKAIQDEEAKKVRKKYIIYGLIVVAGYFAYKKFKK